MRKLVSSRLFRCTLCLILVCCMIFNCIAIKAEASVLGAAAVLFGDDAALAIIAACLTGLGVMANLETEMDTLTFRHLCEDAYDAMAAAGEWVVDGAVTAYNCATELWDYGVDCGIVQWLHEWLWDSDYLSINLSDLGPMTDGQYDYFIRASSFPYAICWYSAETSYWNFIVSRNPFDVVWTDKYGGLYMMGVSEGTATYFYVDLEGNQSVNQTITDYNIRTAWSWCGYEGGEAPEVIAGTTYDLTLGTVAPPGTDIETEYGEYIVIVAPNGVPDTGGDGSGDEQPQIPIIPVPIMPSYDETIQLPQEDIWKGNKVETEDPDTGGSTDPTTGTDTDDPDSGSNDPTTPTTGTDTDPDTQPDSPGAPSTDIGDYQIDLKNFFPFCIPFDLYDFFTCLNAEPVAPVIEWVIPLPGGGTYPLVIDLSTFDSVAQLLRRLQLLLFCVGLAFKTRDLIKG